MNESNLFYRLFINFCVGVAIGMVVILLEYTAIGETAVSLKTLWYILVSGIVIGVVFEILFVNVFPLSGNHLRRNILWRNRMISAVVNAIIISVLGRVMLGTGNSMIFLLLLSIALCVAAIVVCGIISDIRYRHNIKEMNRRLNQLNSLTGTYDDTEGK